MSGVSVQFSPFGNDIQYFDNSGVPLNGGLLYQYQAGSDSIQLATYTGIDGLVANDNPMVLDSSGRPPQAIWLQSNVAYNLVLANSGNTVIDHRDNVTGVPIISAATSSSINVWNPEVDIPTYVSGVEFQIPNNHVTDFAVGNRVRSTCTSGFVFGTVNNVSFSAGNTFVTMQMDSVNLDSGLSLVEWSSLIANGRTVDAGGVSYSNSLSYSLPGTVGGQIRSLNTAVTNVNTRVDDTYVVNPTTGSGVNTPYVITVDPALTSYTDGQHFTVQFINASSGTPTLNVNGIGALSLLMYDYNAVLQTAVVPAGLISAVAYNGAQFVLLDQQPPIPFTTSSIPHGQVTITANTTFTPGTGVVNINVICQGGGGGGGCGSSVFSGGEDGTWTLSNGGTGGVGGNAWKNISVTPLTSYSVTIGGNGIGGTTLGGVATAGGSTTFGAGLVIATGGGAGSNASGATPGTNGANGIDSTGSFGLVSTGMTVTGVAKGNGGAAGIGAISLFSTNGGPGNPGCCIITW